MTIIFRPAGGEASATSTISPLEKSTDSNDLEIARRRMKHLAPWHVEPIPRTHLAASVPAARPVQKVVTRKPPLFRSGPPTSFQRCLALHLFVAERCGALD
jgi:hypothetical protein